jgi:hypothetical protein
MDINEAKQIAIELDEVRKAPTSAPARLKRIPKNGLTSRPKKYHPKKFSQASIKTNNRSFKQNMLQGTIIGLGLTRKKKK